MSQSVGRLRVEGGNNLRRTLKAAGRQIEELKALHKRVAELVAGRAEETAPVGPAPFHISTTIRAAGTNAAAIVRAGSTRKGRDYAMPLHWGHRTTVKGGAGTVVRAQPWISQAAQDLQPRWTSMYLTEVDRIISTVEGTTTT